MLETIIQKIQIPMHLNKILKEEIFQIIKILRLNFQPIPEQHNRNTQERKNKMNSKF